jgi:hypothetical protein
VEVFSFKSRNLSRLAAGPLTTQMIADASEALMYYGETLDIRRPTLQHLGPEVLVQRVRLFYEGGNLKPENPKMLRAAVEKAQTEARGVEVLFQ